MEFEIGLLERVSILDDVESFRFERPDGYQFEAGQFMNVTVGSGQSRYFSHSESPNVSGYLELTTKNSGSDYKKELFKMGKGDTLKVSEAMGLFKIPKDVKNITFIAGGIGITPIRSMLRWISDCRLAIDCALIYGNNNPQSIAFKEDLERMMSSNDDMLIVHVLEHPKEVKAHTCYEGFISGDIIKEVCPDCMERTHMICGPPLMVENITKSLDDVGIPKKQIMTERFTTC